jgi:RimJ/RimL family protein N-acetyltransferase
VREVAHVTTERLRLAAVTVGDAEALFVIMSDAAGWWYQPTGRHAELPTTIAFCERVAAMWLSDGLSYWTARVLDSDEVVGLGGARRNRDRTWNLSYRIAAGQQGRGFATELGVAAHRAAAIVDPSVAIIAWIDEHNAASRRVAQRIGLTNGSSPLVGSSRISSSGSFMNASISPTLRRFPVLRSRNGRSGLSRNRSHSEST